jgi:hypothetical protein
MKSKNARHECYRLLGRIIGPAAVPEFLSTAQPALEDRTGQELLESDPEALLAMLRTREKEMEALP